MLTGVRVIDASGSEASACIRFLRSLNAEIVREPPLGPSVGLSDDILLCDAPLVVDLRAIEARSKTHPRLIQVFITPFGLRGPHANRRGGELVASAMGGVLNGCGYPDRAPVKEAGDACWFHAGMIAAAGAVFALHERAASGLGQCVDVSVQEVAASRTTNALLAWQFDERRILRAGPALNYGRTSVRCVWELADGHVFHSLMTGGFGAPANKALSDWMDERGAENPLRDVDWIAYDRSALPAETRRVWETAIAAFFRTLTKSEIDSEGRRRGINAASVNEPDDVLKDGHLRDRGFFAEERGVRAPARFVRVVDASSLGPSTRPEAKLGEGPLAGVRVLDFSWALVGSFTTKTLGDFGAQVVKLESSSRPCLSRLDVQVGVSKRGEFDDKPWFAHINTSKLGMRLNLKHPRAREVLDPLIDWADVIVENFSPGTMQALGLDYEALSARRPDLVMVSGSVYGQTGPLAKEWGVDGTGAALSGRLALTGWPDRTPVSPSAPYGDVIMPPVMAAAAIAALHRRRSTGRGCHIDASMYEVCVQQMADALFEAQAGGRPRRNGNRDPRMLLQGVYPTRGDDRWIAISITDLADWRAFAGAAGGDWPDDPRSADADALDSRISAWTAPQDGFALMDALQAVGVAAGVVQDASDIILRDAQLRERNFLVPLVHPVLGAFAHQATPIAFSRSARPMFPAPRLGEHTEWICRELIGLSAEAVNDLRAADVFV